MQWPTFSELKIKFDPSLDRSWPKFFKIKKIMAQKIHPWGVIWVPSNRPQVGHWSEKNDDLAVQYEDVDV